MDKKKNMWAFIFLKDIECLFSRNHFIDDYFEYFKLEYIQHRPLKVGDTINIAFYEKDFSGAWYEEYKATIKKVVNNEFLGERVTLDIHVDENETFSRVLEVQKFGYCDDQIKFFEATDSFYTY